MYPLHLDCTGEGVDTLIVGGFLGFLVLLDWGDANRSCQRGLLVEAGLLLGSAVAFGRSFLCTTEF